MAHIEDYPVRVETAIIGGETVQFARIDTEKAHMEKVAEMCGDGGSVFKAANADREYAPEWACSGEAAVYIIASTGGEACKIGHSRNPMQRLGEIQTGSPTRLFISHLFWTPYETAKWAENYALKIMEHRGRRCVGEWVDAEPSTAAEVVAFLLSHSGSGVSNSAMHIQNLRNIKKLAGGRQTTLTRGAARFDPEEWLGDKIVIGG